MYKGNPKNQENALYRALTRIFSGPITKRRRQFYRREKRRDLQKYDFKSASGQEFKKYSKDMFSALSTKMISEQQRAERYSDFDAMLFTPELAAALDVYADEITTSTMFEDLLKIQCKNPEIKGILHEFCYNVLNIDMNLYYWVRSMCKNGDFFLYLDVDDDLGITNVIGLPTREIERMEGLDSTNPNYVQFQWNSGGMTFENWQIAHFRILGDDKYAPYGQCLVGDTRILTPNGVCEIQNININDEIFSFDLETHKKVKTKVLNKICSGEKECLKISSKHNFIDCSQEHPILIWEKNENKFVYKKAIDVKIGDLLVVNDDFKTDPKECSFQPVISVENIGIKLTYDVHVMDKNHNFFANECVVHNSILDPARRIWRQLCVASGSSVLTEDGYKPIEQISKNDIVYCYDPEKDLVRKTSVVAQKYMGKQKVYKLRTSHRNIKVTDNHGMLVKTRDGQFIYKKAKEILLKKDRIPLVVKKDGLEEFPLNFDTSGYYLSLKEKPNYCSKNIMNKIDELCLKTDIKTAHEFLNGGKRISYKDATKIIQLSSDNFDKNSFNMFLKGCQKKSLCSFDGTYIINKDFAKLFGFLLGDGWITKGRAKVGFATGVDEKQNEYYKNLLQKLSRSRAHIMEPIPGKSGGQVNIHSKEFSTILEKADFKTGACNKEVPSWIFSMSLEIRREFIKGYFDADGSYSDGRATSISRKLLEGIRELAMISGVPCGPIKKDKKEGLYKDGCYRQQSYRLYLNMNENKWSNDVVYERAIDFEYVGEEDTYDIQVEDDLHNFIVNGMVSHNTLLEDAMMAYRIVRCLHGDTNVWTPNGHKKIKDIKTGEKVFSYDYENKKLQISTVTDWIDNGKQKIWEVKTKHRTIKSNNNHPFLTKNKLTGEIGYINVDKLIPSLHQLVCPNNSDEYELIENIIQTEEESNVYDIRVDNDLHNFIANGCVVHNSPERRVFYLDVGNIAPEDVKQFVLDFQTEMKKNQVIDQDTGRVDLRYNALSNFPNDFIHLCDNSKITFKELAENWNDRKKDFYTWSLDENHNVIPSKILWAGKTQENAKFVEIELDDGQKIKTTPEHKWMTRDGEYIQAKDLNVGQSLMPYYLKRNEQLKRKNRNYDKNFYTEIYNPGSNKYKSSHKIVAEHMHGSYEWPYIVHHKNRKKYDNNPTNLQLMTQQEHAKVHEENVKLLVEYAKSEKGRETSRKTLLKTREKYDFNKIAKDLWENPKIRKKRIDKLTFKTDSRLISYVVEALNQLGTESREYQIRNYLNNNENFIQYLCSLNENFKNGHNKKILKMQFLNQLRKNNFKNIREVKDFYVSLKAPWNKVVEFCKKNNTTKRSDIYNHFHISKYDFSRLVKINNLTLEKFDELFLNGGYYNSNKSTKCQKCEVEFSFHRSEERKFCSLKCYHNSLRKNHKIVSIKWITEENTDAYGITVDSSTHVFSMSGENYEQTNENHTTSGVFIKNSVEEDYIIPVRGQTQTKIDTLQGGQYTGDIEDVKYLQEKLLAAIKIPSAYLLSSETNQEDKTTLAQKDVRFSRTIQRIQRSVIAELEKICTIHLYTLGFRDDDLLNFSLSLANPSKISELQELEHWRTKFDVASSATEGFFSQWWVASKLFGQNEDEFIRNRREIMNDKKFQMSIEQLAQGMEGEFGEQGAGSIPVGGGMGGEPFGNEPMDIVPPEDDIPLEPPPGEGNDTLLAQPEEPGKRDDGVRKIKIKNFANNKQSTTTDKSKGKWYTPVNKRSKMGDRKKHIDSLWNRESSKKTNRSNPARELIGLGSGIMENNLYLQEESQINTINESLKEMPNKLGETKSDNSQEAQ